MHERKAVVTIYCLFMLKPRLCYQFW